jgi:hypothetical protein
MTSTSSRNMRMRSRRHSSRVSVLWADEKHGHTKNVAQNRSVAGNELRRSFVRCRSALLSRCPARHAVRLTGQYRLSCDLTTPENAEAAVRFYRDRQAGFVNQHSKWAAHYYAEQQSINPHEFWEKRCPRCDLRSSRRILAKWAELQRNARSSLVFSSCWLPSNPKVPSARFRLVSFPGAAPDKVNLSRNR